ncbi:MAG: hypothetical protein EH225_05300 [Calditrichaeota bacterium]|nr:hypothetical protein [Spirochaetales bacterium]RQW04868.1 MAG: hypothetical protein EH225_05300 [Calditrichota bacterium]
MQRPTKTFLNFLFFLVCAGGFAVIFFNERIEYQLAPLLPTFFIIFYGLIVSGAIKECNDFSLAEHLTDTIYYGGFLFTLMSLVALFFKLKDIPEMAEGHILITMTLSHLAIAITTSMAGMLIRSLVRGRWLKLHPEEEGDLEKSYEMLKAIADQFSSSYSDTFDSIKAYLEEKVQTAAAVDHKEKEYLASLDRFISASDRYAAMLEKQNSQYGNAMENLSRSGKELFESSDKMRAELDRLPLKEINDDLNRFRGETGELNLVLDSLVEILENKVEKVR